MNEGKNMKQKSQHPEMTKSETADRYHTRCADYHTAKAAEYMVEKNLRDSAHEKDIAALHMQLAAYLAIPAANSAEMSQDERDDTAITR